MIFVWGSKLYGKVDEVPGMFHVATKFGHLWYIPLIPMNSHVIFEEHDEGWEGIQIPLSGKSVFIAWLRTALIVGALWAAFGMVAGFVTGAIMGGMASGIGLAISIGLFVLTKKLKAINSADFNRARELAQKAGFNEEGMQLLESHFMAAQALDEAKPIQPS